jgi:nitroreductase
MSRQTDTKLDPIFLERWSPRAFDGSVMPTSDLMTIIDAARWAPSAFNYQPWRILYALRGDQNWDRFLSVLIPFNQGWAKDASVLLFIVSDTISVGPDGPTPFYSHSFDTGAAWAQLGSPGAQLGLPYPRYDRDRLRHGPVRTRSARAIPYRSCRRHRPQGGHPSVLPEGLRGGEVPSDRKPIAEIAFCGQLRCLNPCASQLAPAAHKVYRVRDFELE